MKEEQCLCRVQLRPTAPLKLPGQVDCNSPAHWDGETLFVFTSAGHPFRSFGRSLFDLSEPHPVRFNNQVNGGRWIESTWKADDGTLYGWYHFEPSDVCPGTTLTAPQIGALRSHDNGATWEDLGIVLKAPDEMIDCTAQNGYFAGGHGDFCVVLDERKEWLYFFFGNYGGEVATQGVCVARMRWHDRDDPVGKVWKWCDDKWDEPGLGGWQGHKGQAPRRRRCVSTAAGKQGHRCSFADAKFPRPQPPTQRHAPSPVLSDKARPENAKRSKWTRPTAKR